VRRAQGPECGGAISAAPWQARGAREPGRCRRQSAYDLAFTYTEQRGVAATRQGNESIRRSGGRAVACKKPPDSFAIAGWSVYRVDLFAKDDSRQGGNSRRRRRPEPLQFKTLGELRGPHRARVGKKNPKATQSSWSAGNGGKVRGWVSSDWARWGAPWPCISCTAVTRYDGLTRGARRPRPPLVAAGCARGGKPRGTWRGNPTFVFTLVTATADSEEVTLRGGRYRRGARHAGLVVVDNGDDCGAMPHAPLQKLWKRAALSTSIAPVFGRSDGWQRERQPLQSWWGRQGGRCSSAVRPLFELLGKTILHMGRTRARARSPRRATSCR